VTGGAWISRKEINMILVAFVLFAVLLAGWLLAPTSSAPKVAVGHEASAPRLQIGEAAI